MVPQVVVVGGFRYRVIDITVDAAARSGKTNIFALLRLLSSHQAFSVREEEKELD